MMLKEKKFGEKDPLVSTQDPEDPFLELQGIFGKIGLRGRTRERLGLSPKFFATYRAR